MGRGRGRKGSSSSSASPIKPQKKVEIEKENVVAVIEVPDVPQSQEPVQKPPEGGELIADILANYACSLHRVDDNSYLREDLVTCPFAHDPSFRKVPHFLCVDHLLGKCRSSSVDGTAVDGSVDGSFGGNVDGGGDDNDGKLTICEGGIHANVEDLFEDFGPFFEKVAKNLMVVVSERRVGVASGSVLDTVSNVVGTMPALGSVAGAAGTVSSSSSGLKRQRSDSDELYLDAEDHEKDGNGYCPRCSTKIRRVLVDIQEEEGGDVAVEPVDDSQGPVDGSQGSVDGSQEPVNGPNAPMNGPIDAPVDEFKDCLELPETGETDDDEDHVMMMDADDPIGSAHAQTIQRRPRLSCTIQ